MVNIKVFVATKETQGDRDNDFFWSKEGELVLLPFECDGEEIDGGCGCRRCMSGFESFKSTTTFKVKSLSRSPEWYIRAVRQALQKAGWLKMGVSEKEARNMARELLRKAHEYPEGTVLERRGNEMNVRREGEKRRKRQKRSKHNP